MNSNIIRLAWRGESPPTSLPEPERLQFLLLRGIYQNYKSGRLMQEEAERMKQAALNYSMVSQNIKERLIEYQIGVLSGRWENATDAEHEAFKAEIKELSAEYLKITQGDKMG